MNLSSLAAVRAGAEAFLREEDSLDILVNNAGIGLLPKRLTTDDGLEMQVRCQWGWGIPLFSWNFDRSAVCRG